METLMRLKGVVLGVRDLLSMAGLFGLLKFAMFSTALLAQTSGAVEVVRREQGEQGTRITRLEDWRNSMELIRNFEYGALLVMGGFVTWFLKETAKNTNKIAVLGAGHGHLGDSVTRIEKKLDNLLTDRLGGGG